MNGEKGNGDLAYVNCGYIGKVCGFVQWSVRQRIRQVEGSPRFQHLDNGEPGYVPHVSDGFTSGIVAYRCQRYRDCEKVADRLNEKWSNVPIEALPDMWEEIVKDLSIHCMQW